MKKLALNIGINVYSPAIYGTGSNLKGCLNDCTYMNSLAKDNGFTSTTLKDKSATKSALLSWIRNAVSETNSGDFIYMSQSSHGTRTTMKGKEVNGICMYDGILWDFELKAELIKIKKGVNVIWATDTCFSENNFRFAFAPEGQIKYLDYGALKGITLPKSVQWVGVDDFKCNFIQYASSTAFQVSYDLGSGGLFTESLKKAVRINPAGNYYKIFQETEKAMATSGYPQTPRFIVINGNDVLPKGLTYNKFLN